MLIRNAVLVEDWQQFEYDNNKYIFYFLKSIGQQLDKKGTGTTFRAISGETITTTEIPIPPLPEQQAIVAKIEELLSDLENGKQQLQTAGQQLKIYRQSLLKWAFEGIEKSKMISVEECCSNIVDCLHSTAKFTTAGYYCVDTTCIDNGKVMFEKIRYVDERTYLERISRLKPQEGDILFAREGTVGTTVIVPRKCRVMSRAKNDDSVSIKKGNYTKILYVLFSITCI